MPLYEYQCQACSRRLEKIQKFSDAELTVCPHCGGRLERLLTAPAVQFKGSGWYKDLYSSAKPPAASGSGETSSSASGSGESSTAKPAEAPASSAGSSSASAAPAPASANAGSGSASKP